MKCTKETERNGGGEEVEGRRGGKQNEKLATERFLIFSTLLLVPFSPDSHQKMRALNARTCPASSNTSKSAAAPRQTMPNAAAAPIPSPISRRLTTIASASTGGGGPSLLQKLGRVFTEKAQADIERVFKGASKTREKLGVSLFVLGREEIGSN